MENNCMNNGIKLTFDKSVKEDILSSFNKDVREGFIVEKDEPSQKVFTDEGEEVLLEEFGGLKKGSEVFIKNDVTSLMRLSKD